MIASLILAAFAPPVGRTLLIVGQDAPAIAAYEREVGGEPAGFMAYTSIERLEGLDEPTGDIGGVQHARRIADEHPGRVLQLGLHLGSHATEIAEGKLDGNVDRLLAWIKEARRPVYLRIGYEFDLPENHLEPEPYRRAFRRIVDRARAERVGNVAFVWHSFAQPIARPRLDWYPGDGYVDWMAVSYFDQKETRELDEMGALARERHKPLMIAESSPWRLAPDRAWDAWFVPMLRYVERYDVRALCFIDWNWDAIPMFRDQKWGDARLERDPSLVSRWRTSTDTSRFMHGGPGLFDALGFRR